MKKCCSLKLDRCIYLDLIYNSRQLSIEAIFIENYENQFSRSVFHAYPCYVFKFSFLTTLDMYKNYYKGHLSWWNLMQRFYSSILWLETIFPNSSFSWRSCCICMCGRHGFKNRYGQRTGIESDSRFYGRTGVGLMVEPMMS